MATNTDKPGKSRGQAGFAFDKSITRRTFTNNAGKVALVATGGRTSTDDEASRDARLAGSDQTVEDTEYRNRFY